MNVKLFGPFQEDVRWEGDVPYFETPPAIIVFAGETYTRTASFPEGWPGHTYFGYVYTFHHNVDASDFAIGPCEVSMTSSRACERGTHGCTVYHAKGGNPVLKETTEPTPEPAPEPTPDPDRKSTRLNSSHSDRSRMPSSA